MLSIAERNEDIVQYNNKAAKNKINNRNCQAERIDPFMTHHKLVNNGGFPKFEILYCSQNTVKSIKIEKSLSYKVYFSKSQNLG